MERSKRVTAVTEACTHSSGDTEGTPSSRLRGRGHQKRTAAKHGTQLFERPHGISEQMRVSRERGQHKSETLVRAQNSLENDNFNIPVDYRYYAG